MQSHADGSCSELEERFLGMRSDGGFGLVETCAAHVSQDGKAWPGELGVHDDAMIPGLTRLARGASTRVARSPACSSSTGACAQIRP